MDVVVTGKPEGVCQATTQIFPFVDGPGVGKKGREEEGDGGSVSLLASGCGVKGDFRMGRRQRSARRKVKWNDRHGNSLVEILEFQPRAQLITLLA